ncbi:MAG TPA: phenylalanine--tRNA ligase subunit beta [Candidatus Nitrosocosmicus sp.]|nr:phenylalanine--tRNA ligase subunit beta [Candidatus Nitrosocosmicus sp.]
MPVVNVRFSALTRHFPRSSPEKLIEEIPYLGLDIEAIDERNGVIKIEFNPNRPDFASENGVIRGLRGILGEELGLPRMKAIRPSGDSIFVDENMVSVRPIIYGLVAKREISLDDVELTQLIAMQEDLHNGLGRKRKKSSIGIHNYDVLKFPLYYGLESKKRKFIPLDSQGELSIDQILSGTSVGNTYSHLLNNRDTVPILNDSSECVVSIPPIINGAKTKVDTDTRNLFVEVTGTNSKTAREMLAIFAYELTDMGYEIFSLDIHSPFEGNYVSPNLEPTMIEAKIDQINKLLGLSLTSEKVIECLRKCRCDGMVNNGGFLKCIAPSYRIDLFEANDVLEEVAIGYGIKNLEPDRPSEYFSGKKNIHSLIFNKVSEVLIGLGFIEIVNPNIISKQVIDHALIHEKDSIAELIWLGDSKNTEFEVLRTSLFPSMINTLSANIHEKYPQKLFEIGKIFKTKENSVQESWSLCVSIAHDNADYSEIKSNLESVFKYSFNISVSTPRIQTPFYLDGHSAQIMLNSQHIGHIGEVHPQVLENFNMKSLVSMFEIDMSNVIQALRLNERHFF